MKPLGEYPKNLDLIRIVRSTDPYLFQTLRFYELLIGDVQYVYATKNDDDDEQTALVERAIYDGVSMFMINGGYANMSMREFLHRTFGIDAE